MTLDFQLHKSETNTEVGKNLKVGDLIASRALQDTIVTQLQRESVMISILHAQGSY
jgi:hypothetical protein